MKKGFTDKYFDSQNGFFVENGELIRYIGRADVVKIPSTVTQIGKGAFTNNEKIKKVIIPSRVKCIRENAFWSCSNLEEIVLNEGLEEIGATAFLGATRLKNVHIPASVKRIGQYAFANCYSLKTIDIPDSLSLSSNICMQSDKTKINRYKTYTANKVIMNKKLSDKKSVTSESDRKIIERKKVGGKEGSASNDFIKKAQEFKVAYDAKVKLVDELQKQVAKLEKENKELSATVKSQGDTISSLTAELEEVSRILSE